MSDIQSPPQQASAFSLAVWAQGSPTPGVSAITTDPDPNVTPPSTSRILRITPKRGAVEMFGGANGATGPLPLLLLVAIGGTSVSAVPWFYDDTRAVWVQYQAAIAVASPGNSGAFVRDMTGAKFFCQVTVVTGTVTALGYDYV